MAKKSSPKEKLSPLYKDRAKVPTIPYVLNWIYDVLADCEKGKRVKKSDLREAMRMMEFLVALCGLDPAVLKKGPSLLKDKDMDSDFNEWIYNFGGCSILKPIIR